MALISACVTVFLMPFYSDLISVKMTIQGHTFDIGYIVSYVFLTAILWVLLTLIFNFNRFSSGE